MLTLRNFSKSYNDRLILKIDQLEFNSGVYWIKGENGSGKTTLFESVAGILPCVGEIVFSDGINIRQNPVAYRQRVNYGEAEPQYPGFLTAKDLVRFVGKTRGSTQQQQEHYVKWFGVDSFFENPCETYSSGMMKKLSLALSFLGTPKIIILDEPLITLDQQAREILFELIRKKLQEGMIFLISSHHTITEHDIPLTQTYLVENKTLTAQ